MERRVLQVVSIKAASVLLSAFLVGCEIGAKVVVPEQLTQDSSPVGPVLPSVEFTAGAPAGLTYSVNPAVYTRGTPITSQVPTSTGGAVVSYSVSPALPAGLSLDTVSGVISGTPTAIASVASFIVTATNSVGSTTTSLSITVNDMAPSFTYPSSPVSYNLQIGKSPNTPVSVGGAVMSYSVSPALPAGLSLNTSSGVISGVPTVAVAATNYTVTGTNSGGSSSVLFNVTVKPAPEVTQISTSPGTLAPGFAVNTLAYSLATFASSLALTVTIQDPSVPVKLQLNGGAEIDLASGVSSASLPLNLGTNTIQIHVTGSAVNYIITVTRNAPAGPPPTPGAAISFTGTGQNTVHRFVTGMTTVNWGAATDTVTAQASLEYRVVRSLDPSLITTESQITGCAAPSCSVVQDWTANITSKAVSGIFGNSQHFFAVAVRNGASQVSVYSPQGVETSSFVTKLNPTNASYYLLAHDPSVNAGVLLSSTAQSALSTSFVWDTGSTLHVSSLLAFGAGNVLGSLWHFVGCSWISVSAVFNPLGLVSGYVDGQANTCGANRVSFPGPLVQLSNTGDFGIYQKESNGSAWLGRIRTSNYAGSTWSLTCPALEEPHTMSSTFDGTSGWIFGTTTITGTQPRLIKVTLGSGCLVYTPLGTSVLGTGRFHADSVVSDGSGNIYVAYVNKTDGTGKAAVEKFDGTSFSYVGSNLGVSAGGASQVSVYYLNSALYAVYRDHTIGGDVTVLKWNGSSWDTLASNLFGEEVNGPRMYYDSGSSNLVIVAMRLSNPGATASVTRAP